MANRNEFFDVDCPRTPDADDDKLKKGSGNEHGNNGQKTKTNSSSIASKYKFYTAIPNGPGSGNGTVKHNSSANRNAPRLPHSGSGNGNGTTSQNPWNRSRTAGRSAPSPRGRSADAQMATSARRAAPPKVGLEPEERIVPVGGTAPVTAPATAMAASRGLRTPQRAAPLSGPGGSSHRYHSVAETNSPNNPFVDASYYYNATPPSPSPAILEFSANSNRQRSASDSWWREEIVDEALDKTNKMEDYYGLSSSEKMDLYGKSNKNDAFDRSGGVKSKNPFEQCPPEWEEEYLTARRKAGYTTVPSSGGGSGAVKDKKKTKTNSKTSTAVGGVAIGIGYNADGSIESALVDIEQQRQGGEQDDDDNEEDVEEVPMAKGMPYSGQPMMSQFPLQQQQQKQPQKHQKQQPQPMQDPAISIYEKATQIHNSGQYREQVPVVDDYSFSVVDLPKANNGNAYLNDSANGNNNGNNSNGYGFLQISKWFSALVPGSSSTNNNQSMNSRTVSAIHSTYPPNMTSETNIAPPLRGNSQEWWANSPKVTFDTEYHRQHKKLRWSQMNTTQKIGLAVVIAAVVCSIMGIAVSQMSGNGTNTKNGDPGLSSGATGYLPVVSVGTHQPTLVPTEAPTDVPSAYPTRRPTKAPTTNPTPSPTPHPTIPPITSSPIAGNVAIHGKSSNGTPRPTRSPVTSPPTSPPTRSPTAPPITSVQKAPSSPSFPCADDDRGIYINHLGNPKDCAWLYNDKDGYTDRKDKNCGSASYHMTELGAHCQATCALYNGCTPGSAGSGSMVQMSNGDGSSNGDANEGAGADANTKINAHVVDPSTSQQPRDDQPTLVTICTDRLGTYLNHLSNPKTCEWLYNDKEGKTDRKDKNCGGPDAAYPITELGKNCPATCIDYNGDGCSTIEVYPNDTHGSNGGDSSSTSTSTGDSKTVRTSGGTLSSSTSCVNGSGFYLDHIGVLKQCQWLHGDNPSSAKSRQNKNCGTEDYPITELGKECPWSCQDYNGCNQQ